MKESALHIQVADFLCAALAPEVPWTTIGHGGFLLPIRTAVALKRRGVRAGFPDILIVWRGRCIMIELKKPADLLSRKGRLSKPQISMQGALVGAGALVLPEATSVADVEDFLRMVGVPMRGRLAA